MRKLTILLMIASLLFMSVAPSVFGAFTAVNVGPTTDFAGDINIPSGKSYYINGTLLALSDITTAGLISEAMLDGVAGPVDEDILTYESNTTNFEWHTPAELTLTVTVGTPADSQVGVWTGDGTLEGDASFTYDQSNMQFTGDLGSTGTPITKGWFTDLEVTNAPTVGGIARNYVEHFMDVHATDSDYCHAQMEGSVDSQPITTAITSPDVPRNLEVTFSATEDTESGVVTITGTLAAGTTAQTETFTFTSDSVVVGTKAFATITKINIPAGSMNGIEIDVGIGDLLGLSNTVSAEGDVYKITLDSIDSSVIVSGNVDTTYNTVDCSDVVDNSDYTIWYHN